MKSLIMGAINSLIDTPGGYSVLQRNSETWHCRFCGSAYNDVCTKDMIHISGLENHHPAELCGIWLGKLYLNQTRDIRLSDFRAISTSPLHCAENECNFESTGSPLITLPKRSCAPAKSHVATLLRHSDATKNHSTLREEFFSTMDIRNSSSAQYTELEGCRITGCLFVEHGNLVFQAISKRSRIPFLLIDQQMLGPTSDCISSAFNSFKGGFPDDPKTHNSIQNSSLICSSTESSSHLINLDKSGQKCLISHVDNPYASTNRCSEDFKPRHPPPPLRLSWPLVTLRRFGFYGNSLFKVETGRRAPRGEGIYLFRIKHLREFRKSFEVSFFFYSYILLITVIL
ncbi:Pleckstrin y type [Schistosoma japonicum]|nr:Pleckstrin y type [Schistosoma japonicum]